MTAFLLDDPTPRDPRLDWPRLDQGARDASYDNTNAVADSAERIATRNAAAARYRAAHPAGLDIPYAEGERTGFDLFPVADAQAPCFVFIHGGYWQRNARADFAGLAAGLNDAGWAVALPGYTLPGGQPRRHRRRDRRVPRLARGGGEGPRDRRADHPLRLVGGGPSRRPASRAPRRGGGARHLRRLRPRPDPRHLPEREAVPHGRGDRDALAPAPAGDGQADDARLWQPRIAGPRPRRPPLHALRAAAHAPGALLPVPGADHFSILDGFSRSDGLFVRAARDLLDSARACRRA